jgi:hypothetical protein
MKTKRISLGNFFWIVLLAGLSLYAVSCDQVKNDKDSVKQEQSEQLSISEQEVLNIQEVWGNGIVEIGKVYDEDGDFKQAALNHIEKLYGYDLGPVLFKPTLASKIQFRTSKEGALSYFVGGNPSFNEDHGFAIKPWKAVRWESVGIKIIGNMAIAMGNYYFTPAKGGDEVKVEYTFAYTKDKNGDLKIILHGSYLPYTPTESH